VCPDGHAVGRYFWVAFATPEITWLLKHAGVA